MRCSLNNSDGEVVFQNIKKGTPAGGIMQGLLKEFLLYSFVMCAHLLDQFLSNSKPPLTVLKYPP